MPSASISAVLGGTPSDRRNVTTVSCRSRHSSASFCPAGVPLGVARPTSTDQVQTVLRWATRHRVPVVPQGARTGLSGAANAVDGALMLSLLGMNRILRIDEIDQVAIVEPGVINAALSRAIVQ